MQGQRAAWAATANSSIRLARVGALEPERGAESTVAFRFGPLVGHTCILGAAVC